ncbi:MAG: DNA-binding protein [Gallionella sp.]|nr:DNA-binding protein [Gallionella sp.]
MSTLVTYEKVSAAAQKLMLAGQRPTVRLLIATLGGGSPNAVLPLLNRWKAAQSTSTKSDLTLEPVIAKVIAQQLAVMTAQATAEADSKLIELAADAELISQAGQAAEQACQQLELELVQTKSQVQQLTGQLTERSMEIESIRSEAAKQVTALQESLAHERELAQAIRDELLRSQFKLEGLAALQTQVQSLTDRCQEAEHAAASFRLEAAVAQTKLAAQLEREQLKNQS